MTEPERDAVPEIGEHDDHVGADVDADEGEPDITPFAGADGESDPDSDRSGGHGYGYE